jgi:citrate synthase
LTFAADLAAGFATGFFSALRAGDAALEGFNFAGAFLDFEAVLAMVLNQSTRGNDREMCRVTPRFRDVAQAARRYRCR